MPRFIEPSLATLRDITRRGHNWTSRLSDLAIAAGALPDFPVVLDGEVVVPNETGHSDFGALEADLGAGRSDRMLYYVFDILHIGPWSLRNCALADRKTVLAELLCGQKGPIRFSDHLEGGGQGLFKQACKLGLEAWCRNASMGGINLAGPPTGQRWRAAIAKLFMRSELPTRAASLMAYI
jgi:ATP-dependent DNA ligase